MFKVVNGELKQKNSFILCSGAVYKGSDINSENNWQTASRFLQSLDDLLNKFHSVEDTYQEHYKNKDIDGYYVAAVKLNSDGDWYVIEKRVIVREQKPIRFLNREDNPAIDIAQAELNQLNND